MINDNTKVFIIIPCYNETANLSAVISSVKNYGQVVVVDDGSIDSSEQVAREWGVVVLKHLLNRGQGAALATGNRYALNHGADIIVHFDADGQHQAEDLPKLIQPIINNEVEVVLGSRFLKKDNQIPWFKKWLILKLAVIFQNLMFGIKLTDSHNGFRAFSKKALEKIRITQDGMAHGSEIVEQIISHKLRYKEFPVTIMYHEFGQGIVAGLRILKDLLFGKINK